jgi:DNA repair protein RadC
MDNQPPEPDDRNSKAEKSCKGHYKRLRQRFLKDGFAGFHDYEIVELLLMLGQTRTDRKDSAKAAIKEFKNLLGVLEASPEELLKIEGIGRESIFGIKLARETARLYLEERAKKEEGMDFSSSQAVYNYLYQTMCGLKKEVFKVLFLNKQNKLLAIEDLFSGTIDASAVFPRGVVEAAIKYQATGLIFVHNHPSGNPSPSQEDRAITRDLIFAVRTIQVKVLDHIIIGDNCRFSFAAEGLIARYESEAANLKIRG